jgi:diphthine-ammonia ligase
MKLAVLFSGGKDSSYALLKAMEKHEVVCLITVQSDNPYSFMFHTPNISIVEKQADAIGIPMVTEKTEGEKEIELKDLERAIARAKKEYKIEGVVTGAIESVYQASRIQKICNKLNLWCFNPLWKMDQVKLLEELLEKKFEIIIGGVFAEPFDESWLGKRIDRDAINSLIKFADEWKINPAGEGGEIETTVLDAPFFRKKIVIKKAEKDYSKNSGFYHVKSAELVGK